uniref:Peroxiredoxin-2 n=1 Tax=Sphaerodactylus townsendi TaxID=933632 RepID=A0ACB8EJB7_9SAUR
MYVEVDILQLKLKVFAPHPRGPTGERRQPAHVLPVRAVRPALRAAPAHPSPAHSQAAAYKARRRRILPAPRLLSEEGSPHTGPLLGPTRTTPEKMSSGNAHIGKPAPDFTATAVVNGAFKELKLSDYKGKYLVFFFYPLDFTFVCPTEITTFSDRVEEFRKINCEVVAASVDSHFTHLAWISTPRKEGGLGPTGIPLVADINHSIAKDYGVLKEDDGIAYRGLFIIDDKGIVRQITVNDLPVGRSVDETLRLVQAFQFTDQHGEVCPAGWQPGGDTIKPTVKDSKEYFAKQQ